MAAKMFTHLMFEGQAQRAIDLYSTAFTDAELLSVERFPDDHGSHAGQIRIARLRLMNGEFILIDSQTHHHFTFTPAMSVFVEFDDEAELLTAINVLQSDGTVLMPLDNYGFSEKFAWLQDPLGVSWQLSLN